MYGVIDWFDIAAFVSVYLVLLLLRVGFVGLVVWVFCGLFNSVASMHFAVYFTLGFGIIGNLILIVLVMYDSLFVMLFLVGCILVCLFVTC